jgi:hypothetical protein
MIDMIEKYPALYLLIRNDLPSLNPGKAHAHAAHAANQFVHEIGLEGRARRWALFEEWKTSANGFGTTIALSVNLLQLQTAVRIAKLMGFASGETVDPTYPYTVNQEIADLLAMVPDLATAPAVIKNPSTVACFRRETTAGYVFGDKTELQPILGNFLLVP